MAKIVVNNNKTIALKHSTVLNDWASFIIASKGQKVPISKADFLSAFQSDVSTFSLYINSFLIQSPFNSYNSSTA